MVHFKRINCYYIFMIDTNDTTLILVDTKLCTKVILFTLTSE